MRFFLVNKIVIIYVLMKTTNSVDKMTIDRGRSIIFYPRSYNTRGENKKHSMLGVTESGKTINVKLRLDEKHEGKENAPSIKEFAKTDFLAKNPCIASDDNSAENPEGILLLSRCIKDNFDSEKGVEVYIARWAVVLSPSSQTPVPHKGLGRMEIKKDSSTVKKLRGLMRKSESENRLDDADAFKKQIDDPVSWSYPAIFYYPEKMISFSLGQTKTLEEQAALDLSSLAKSGIVSGMAVRARNKSNEVVKDTYKEIFSKFIISKTRYQNGIETFKSIIDELNEKFGNEDFKWDAIPIKKINTGPASSRHYGDKDKLSFTRAMFTFDSNDSEPRLAKICARVSYFGDTDNTLLSRLYTISEPLDHPARLDKSGHFSLTFTGEGTKLAHLPTEDSSINQIKDGFSEDESLLRRALWLLEGNVPIIRSNDNVDNNKDVSGTVENSDSSEEKEILRANEQIAEANKEKETEYGSEPGKDDLDESDENPGSSPCGSDEDLSDDEDDFEFNEIDVESEDIEEKSYDNPTSKPSGSNDVDSEGDTSYEGDNESIESADTPSEGIDNMDSEDKQENDLIDEAEGHPEDSKGDDQEGEASEISENQNLDESEDATSEVDASEPGQASVADSEDEKEPESNKVAADDSGVIVPENKKLTGMAASLFGKKKGA